MGKSKLKVHAGLLIDSLNLVESCEKNLKNIEAMEYYHVFNQRAERKIDIDKAKDQLKMAELSLERQIKYVSIEISELKL